MPKRVASDIAMSLRRRIEAGEWSESLRLPNERTSRERIWGRAQHNPRCDGANWAPTAASDVKWGVGHFCSGRLTAISPPLMRTLIGVSPADTMAVRQIIEPKAAVARRHQRESCRSQRHRRRSRGRCEGGGLELFEQCDLALHELVFAASRNELLASLHAILRLIRNQEQWLGIKRRSFSPGAAGGILRRARGDCSSPVALRLLRPRRGRCLRIWILSDGIF